MKRYDSYKDSGVQWIGEVPSHWEVLKFRRTMQIVRGGSPRPIEKYLSEEGFNWIKIGDTIKGNKYISSTAYKIKADGLSATRLVKPGDLILSNSMSFGQPYILSIEGCIHDGWLSLSPSKELYKEFLYYILLSDVCKNQFASQVDGGVVQNLNIDKVKDSLLFLPRLDEQTAIANYLDNKCAKIDNVIATQEKRVDLLRELKQSIITRAVTRGINPDAKMKDSGVEWIGEIPEHWEISTLKHYASFHNGDRSSNYPSGDDLKDSGVIFVTSNNIHNITLESENVESKYITPEKYNSLGGAKLRINDIIYCLRGSIGNCAINKSHSEGTVASSLVAIRAHHFVADYLNYLLHSEAIRHQVNVTMNGSCAANLSAEVVSRYYIPIPPISEQKQIVTYIEQQTSRLDSSITKALRQIELLKEYKQSLITEVVTGKRKVIYN